MIREAKLADIFRLVEVLQEAHERSVYKDRCGVDVNEAKRLLAQAILRHGHRNLGGCLVFVAETDGVVEGLLLATLLRIYEIGDRLMATDVFFVTSERADPRDAGRLLAAMESWAEFNPKAVEVRVGMTGVVGDWRRLAKHYERRGYQPFGAIYRKEFQR